MKIKSHEFFPETETHIVEIEDGKGTHTNTFTFKHPETKDDKYGMEVKIGDVAAFTIHGGIKKGVVVKFTPQGFSFAPYSGRSGALQNVNKDRVVKP
jgi:hypothetical protein